MPAVGLYGSSKLNFGRSTTHGSDQNSSLQVLCAWPVSGQYGPGSRILYYALVTACIFGRKVEWLRNPCLAAALLIPAVAALHGIVLAAVNAPGGVDMDIYGAFQVCAIAVLAAPITVSASQTYYNDPGRNTIFVWSGLVLAGLISLTVQFYRSTPVPCHSDHSGIRVSSDPAQFPYGFHCGLRCSATGYPQSPLRGGSANNIYVIPAPTKLDFNTATLLSAACCIPTVLLLINMWLKILESNARNVHHADTGSIASTVVSEHAIVSETSSCSASHVEAIDNQATIRKTRARKIGPFLKKYLELPFFAGAIFTILIMGERNLFSKPVRYQTEPLANIGQWGPIVGTAIGVIGSGYILLAQAVVRERSPENQAAAPGRTDFLRKVARVLLKLSDWLGTPRQEMFGGTNAAYQETKRREYPTIPGEEERVDLTRVRSIYDQGDSESIRSGVHGRTRTRSRAGSHRSVRTGAEDEITPASPTGVTPKPRRPTLEVPGSSHEGHHRLRHERTHSAASQGSTGSGAQMTPIIHIISMEETCASPEQTAASDLPAIPPVEELPSPLHGPPTVMDRKPD